MAILGTSYGGWFIPEDFKLTKDSFVVSAGVGEDISFDLALQDKYGCSILLLDPTERAITHMKEVEAFYKNKNPFLGNIQPDYISKIKNLQPDLSKLHFKPIGLWKQKDTLKFYYQDNPLYVSQSVIPDMYSSRYSEVPVERLSNLIHQTPDILKLDIEGAEIAVLETLLEDKLFPRLLCVEFDLYLKGKDTNHITHPMIIKILEKGYKIVYNRNYNIVFQLN